MRMAEQRNVGQHREKMGQSQMTGYTVDRRELAKGKWEAWN